MPLHESLSAEVTLTIKVDGHQLTFTESVRRIAGVRYNGVDPRELGYATSDTLESEIRRTITAAIGEAAARCEQFLQRAYPIHTEKKDREDTK